MLRRARIQRSDDARRSPPPGLSATEDELPPGAREYLRTDHPRLLDLRRRYRGHPAATPSLWTSAYLKHEVALPFFRADNAYRWQVRDGYAWDGPDATVRGATSVPTGEINYVLSTYYAQTIDRLGLLERLTEDRAFGNYTVDVDGSLLVSCDLIDSVIEINFLEREIGISRRPHLTVLDIGAGWGRLGHWLTQGLPNLDHALCTDAVAQSTFLCEYYLRHRGVKDRALTIPLDTVAKDLRRRSVDLALNVHSFSECPLEAICWWLDLLVANRVRYLMIVPNTGTELLSREVDGRMLDFSGELARRGFETIACEPKYGAATSVQRLGIYPAWFYLFELTT